MRRTYTIVLILYLIILPSKIIAEEFEDFEYFDTYLRKYKVEARWGTFGTIFGLCSVALGTMITSTGIALESRSLNVQAHFQIIKYTGYTMMGLGGIGIGVGVPFWLHATNRYQEVLEKRQLYFLMTR